MTDGGLLYEQTGIVDNELLERLMGLFGVAQHGKCQLFAVVCVFLGIGIFGFRDKPEISLLHVLDLF